MDNKTKVQAITVSIPFVLAMAINSGFSVPGLKIRRFGFKDKIYSYHCG
jgi:hypothetical protein